MGDIRHTQNIQINKAIGENEKCVFYFTEKTKQTFDQPNIRTFVNRALHVFGGQQITNYTCMLVYIQNVQIAFFNILVLANNDSINYVWHIYKEQHYFS